MFCAVMVYVSYFRAVFTCPGYVPHSVWQHTPIVRSPDPTPSRDDPNNTTTRRNGGAVQPHELPAALSIATPQATGVLPAASPPASVIELSPRPSFHGSPTGGAGSRTTNNPHEQTAEHADEDREALLRMKVLDSLTEEDPLVPPPPPPPPRLNTYEVHFTTRGCIRFCRYCDQYKPDQAYHCHTCRRCVFMMDHHCPWLNNCVGRDNTKFFLLFLLYIPIGAAHMFFTMMVSLFLQDIHFKGIDFSLDGGNSLLVIYYGGAMVLIVTMTIAFGGFAARFWCLTCNGETSISEMISARTGRSGTAAEGPGGTHTLHHEMLFGMDRRWWVVLLPFSPVLPSHLRLDREAHHMNESFNNSETMPDHTVVVVTEPLQADV